MVVLVEVDVAVVADVSCELGACSWAGASAVDRVGVGVGVCGLFDVGIGSVKISAIGLVLVAVSAGVGCSLPSTVGKGVCGLSSDGDIPSPAPLPGP